ncbi:MAG: hypothetical protein ABEH35_05320 [Haloarculaceae archaeon]
MDPQRNARRRQHDRAEHVERVVDEIVSDRSYPVRAEQLADEYGSRELVRTIESKADIEVGEVLATIPADEFDSPTEVRAAIHDGIEELRRGETATVEDREGGDVA